MQGVVQFNGNTQDSVGFQYVRLEAMWQFIKEDTNMWANALRVSLQIPDNSKTPYRIGLAWAGLKNLD